jgi:hypothetical protein
MKSYSIKRIAQELNINPEIAGKVRAIVRGELDREQLYALSPRVEELSELLCYHRPSLTNVMLEVINDLIDGFGVEVIEKPNANGDGRYSDYIEYINTGDSYNATVLRDGGRYWIGTFGDIVERFNN